MEELQRIGELSKLTGIPTSTLRFYETYGIAQPSKEAQNQYRLYTPQDSCRFLITKLLRSFGCNLDAASRIVSSHDLAANLALLEEREIELEKEIRALEERRKGLKDYRLTVGRTNKLLGKVRISRRKAFYRLTSIAGGHVLKKDYLKEFATIWMEHLPFLHYSMSVKSPIMNGGISAEKATWGFSMDEEYISRNHLEIPREAEYYPSADVVETCLVRESAGFLEEADRKVIGWLMENSPYEITGPVIGRFLMIFHRNGREFYLYNLSCSVKKI